MAEAVYIPETQIVIPAITPDVVKTKGWPSRPPRIDLGVKKPDGKMGRALSFSPRQLALETWRGFGEGWVVTTNEAGEIINGKKILTTQTGRQIETTFTLEMMRQVLQATENARIKLTREMQTAQRQAQRQQKKEKTEKSPDIMAANSIVGLAHQQNHKQNEDAFICPSAKERNAYPWGWPVVVIDGAGGHAHGKWATERIKVIINQQLKRTDLPTTPADAIQAAHQDLATINDQQGRLEKRPGGGATVAAISGDWRLNLAYVGDVTGVVLRESGTTKLLTTEIDSRALQVNHTPPHTLAQIEWAKRESPLGHVVTQMLGRIEAVQIHEAETELRPGDKVILFSDGLWGSCSWSQIETTVRQYSPETAVEILTAAQGPDDITVLIVQRPQN